MKIFSLARDVTQNQFWNNVNNHVWNQVSYQAIDQVSNHVWNGVEYQVRPQVWGQIHDHIGSVVGENI